MIGKFNAWMEKVGVDKLLHFFVAAWVVAECKAYGVSAAGIGFVVIVVLAFLKERFLDKEFSAMDFWWSACGGFAPMLLMALKDMIG